MVIEPPNLETLDMPRSWVNRAGRVDRSACLEVTATEVAERVYEPAVGRVVRRGKEAAFVVTLTAYEVERLHASRMPRRLSGDFRTGKSNAMRPAPGSPEDVARQAKLKRRVRASWSPPEVPPPPEALASKCFETSRLSPLTLTLSPEGRGDQKFLANLRRERGVLRVAGAEVLRSPGSLAIEEAGASRTLPQPPDSEKAVAEVGALLDVGLPGNPNVGASCGKMSGLDNEWRQAVRVERWRWNALAVQHFLICPRCRKKKVKLFLPLATAGELRDARIAAVWLRGLRSGPGSVAEARVVERYGMLLERRELRCAGCWGVRYGEVKKGGRRTPSPSGRGRG